MKQSLNTPLYIIIFGQKSEKSYIVSYPKNQVVKFDTPKLGLGLFKKHCLGRCLELKEQVDPAEHWVTRDLTSLSPVSRLCSMAP